MAKKVELPSFQESLGHTFKDGFLYQKQEEILSRTRWRIHSGSLALDVALGGGLPMGKVIQIFGLEGCRKSTTLNEFIKQAQKAGGVGSLTQTENTTDFEWMSAQGVKCDNKAFKETAFIYPPETSFAIHAMDYNERLLKAYSASYPPTRSKQASPGPPFILGIDSLGATQGKDELDLVLAVQEGDPKKTKDEPTPAGIARDISRGIRRIAAMLTGLNASLVYINWQYDKIGVMYGSKTEVRGGRAIKYFNDVSLELSKWGRPYLSERENLYGEQILVKVRKNKTGFQGAEILLDIYNEGGIHNTSSLWSYLKEKKVLESVGRGYYKFPWSEKNQQMDWENFHSSYYNSGEFREKLLVVINDMVRRSPKISDSYEWVDPAKQEEATE